MVKHKEPNTDMAPTDLDIPDTPDTKTSASNSRMPAPKMWLVGSALAVIVATMAWLGMGPNPAQTLAVGVRGENIVRLDSNLDRLLIHSAVTGNQDAEGIVRLLESLDLNIDGLQMADLGLSTEPELLQAIRGLQQASQDKRQHIEQALSGKDRGAHLRQALALHLAEKATSLMSLHAETLAAQSDQTRMRIGVLSTLALLMLFVLLMRLRKDAWELATGNRRLVTALHERKEAEKRSELGETMFQDLVQHASSAIVRIDREGRITFFNRYAEDFFGFSVQEIMGRPIVGSILPQQDQNGVDLNELVQAVIGEGGEHDLIEVETQGADGQRAWFMWNLTPVREPVGRRREVLAIGTDISERRRGEGLLLDQRTILAQVARGESLYRVHEAVTRLVRERIDGAQCSLHDAQGKLLAAPRLPDALIKCFKDWTPPKHKDSSKPFIADLDGDPQFAGAAPGARAGGLLGAWVLPFGASADQPSGSLVIWLQRFRAPNRADEGVLHAAAALCSIAHIRLRLDSDLLEAKEAAEASARDKSSFLARMSHEIRTPMSGLLGILDLMREVDEMAPEARDQVNLAHKSAEGLLTILDDVLDLSKIEAGKLSIEKTGFDLRLLVEDVVDLFAHRAMGKGLNLLSMVDYKTPRHVIGDPTRLRQVLSNLVSNAVKFTEKGDITVSALPCDSGANRIRFEVRDTGIGINKASRERVFDSFSQAHDSTTREYGGTGLGLPLSQELVVRMGGKLQLQSTPGEGSLFHFELSLKPAEGDAPASDAGDRFKKLNVLVVDADTARFKALQLHLQHWAIKADQVDDLATAKQRQGEKSYDRTLVHWDPKTSQQAPNSLHELCTDGCILMLPAHQRFSASRSLQDLPNSTVLSLPLRQAALFDALQARFETVKPDANSALAKPNTRTSSRPQAPQAAPAKTAPKKANGNWIENPQVLLVEDQDVNQIVAIGLLDRLGIKAELANNGAEAVDRVREKAYDLVFMDCEMPIMDGYQATTAIREMESKSGGHVVITALTAHALPEHRERCMSVGMDDYLSKPYKLDDLRKIIDRWLSAEEPDNNADDSDSSAEFAPLFDDSQDETADSTESGSEAQGEINGVDLDAFKEIHDTFGNDIDTLVDSFVDLLPGKLASIREAAEGQEAEQLRQRAHGLKGVCHSVAAIEAAGLCKALEVKGSEADFNGVMDMVKDLDAKTTAAVDVLQKQIGR